MSWVDRGAARTVHGERRDIDIGAIGGPRVATVVLPEHAALIIAAPDLLDALEKVKSALGDRLLAKGPLSKAYAHGVMAEIDAAIRKARGES